MKLELKHLAPYLPYGLKWTIQELKTFTMSGITNSTLYTEEGTVLNWQKHPDLPQALFPILRPLSDLTKEIEVGGERFVPYLFCDDKNRVELISCCATDVIYCEYLEYFIMQKLFEWHFDVFGLIESGLAIDINTIEK